MVLIQRVQIEEERIKVVRTWPEPNSVKDIKVFIGFANFYQHFIKSFSKINISVTSILKKHINSLRPY